MGWAEARRTGDVRRTSARLNYYTNVSHFIHILAALCLALACAVPMSGQRTEEYRSQYHFSPNSGWIGDPDGLVHYAGKHQLFWWGHAISPDMVHWTELPYPILGDPGSYQVTTGSAVLDKSNVSGFGTNSFINFHTLDNSGDQRIGLSTSTGNANNFTDFNLYAHNPILSPPSTPSLCPDRSMRSRSR